jgi:hypothetical protein
VEHAGDRLSFVVTDAGPALESTVVPASFPDARRIDVRELALRELYLAVSSAPETAAIAPPASPALEEVA